MTAEAIARVVADLRATRRVSTLMSKHVAGQQLADRCATLGGPVVDATSIYTSLVERDTPIYLYEDHPNIAPPWENATVCYQNEHGNVVAMTTHAQGLKQFIQGYSTDQIDAHRNLTQPEPWKPAEPVEWDRVKWVISGFVWVGGRTKQVVPMPTSGPHHLWQFAIYEDGQPADLHWVHLLPDRSMQQWDMANLVLLGALNFMNCRNVDIVEPQRNRAEARRIACTGITVHTINVFPTGRSVRSRDGTTGLGVPLTSVRGRFNHYGSCCSHHRPKGLLFGKYEGRYWIPQHARGDSTYGEHSNDYKLVT